jgi:hypothetical protein
MVDMLSTIIVNVKNIFGQARKSAVAILEIPLSPFKKGERKPVLNGLDISIATIMPQGVRHPPLF